MNEITQENSQIDKKSVNLGKHWWTNGETEIYSAVCPENFVAGRISKPISDESRKKMRESHLGKIASDETRQKMSQSRQGKKWWNNGETEIRAKECPDGFAEGRLRNARRDSEKYTPTTPISDNAPFPADWIELNHRVLGVSTPANNSPSPFTHPSTSH